MHPPRPAQVDVTFWLSVALGNPVTIPAGTEVATVRTSSDEAVTFTTDRPLTINIPRLTDFLISHDSSHFEGRTRLLADKEVKHQLFEAKPREDNAFYIGFAPGLAGNTLSLHLAADTAGIGIDPRNPPLVWEYWSEEFNSWQTLDVASDDTKGLNQPGAVVMYLPYEFRESEVSGRRACWVRCRAVRVKGKPFYSASPQITGIEPTTVGGTVPASHNTVVAGERLGRSSGAPGQIFSLANTPILPRRPGETLVVTPFSGESVEWTEVEDFANSGPKDTHFLLDSVAGELRFGPRLWEPNPTNSPQEVQKGAIPPENAILTFAQYRYGGGVRGNVGKGTVTVLKSSIPYVDRVVNRRPAGGGLDQETLANAKERGPLELRSITRAVTAEDYEYLALKATNEVARARCLQPRAVPPPAADGRGSLNPVVGSGVNVPPGTVRVLLVPNLAPDSFGRVGKDQLDLPPRVRQTVREYLDERRLLTSTLEIDVPRYRWVVVEATLALKPKAEAAKVQAEVETALNNYINPLTGGPDGGGWPFGRDLFISEVYSTIQSIGGVDFVRAVKLSYQDDPAGPRTDAGDSVAPPPDGLLVGGAHTITTQARGRT